MSAGKERFVLAAGERAKGAVGPGGAGGGSRGAVRQQTPAPGQELGVQSHLIAPPQPQREGGREARREG